MNLTVNQQRLWTLLKFLIIFNLLAVPLYLMIYYIDFYPLALLERIQVSFFLDLFGLEYNLEQVIDNGLLLPGIRINNNVMAIGEGCTAIRSLFAFTALVVASPRTWGDKKKALIFLPLIYLTNIFRITSLAFVSARYPHIFDLVHMLLWREGLIFLILGCWAYWFTQLAESRFQGFSLSRH